MGRTTVMKNTRIYIKQFGGSMLGYVAVLLLSRWYLGSDSPPRWALPVALSPVVPIGFAAWAVVRAFRRMDELHQKIQLEALAFAFTCTALACVTYGFLEDSVFPPLSGFWVFMLMVWLWGIGLFLAKRRY